MFSKKTLMKNNTLIPYYERINFLKDFPSFGYVKKVLKLYENHPADVFYYNNRERTEVPCIDRDILIISSYEKECNTYRLIQVDFSIPSKYRVLLESNSIEELYPKEKLYKYIKKYKLVHLSETEPVPKQPQIDCYFGEAFTQILNHLNSSLVKNNQYNLLSLKEMLIIQRYESERFKVLEKQFDCQRTLKIRFTNSIERYLNLIYTDKGVAELSIAEVLEVAIKYQRNYELNL